MFKSFQNQFAKNSTFLAGDEDVWILMGFAAAGLRLSRRKWRNNKLRLGSISQTVTERNSVIEATKNVHTSLLLNFRLCLDCILVTIEKLFLSDALINFSSSVSLIETMETGININWKSIEFIRQIETAKSDRTKALQKTKQKRMKMLKMVRLFLCYLEVRICFWWRY